MKGVGEPCAGEPHARFDGRGLETERYGVTAPAPDPTNLHLGLFITWLRMDSKSDVEVAVVLGVCRAGDGPERSARRINAVLAAAFAGRASVFTGRAPGRCCRCCMSSAMTGIFRRRRGVRTPGWGGGYGPGIGCTSRQA